VIFLSSVVDVKKKKGERFDSLLRRFNKRVIASGKLFQARKIRYRERPMSKTRVKGRALRRMEIGDKREWLRKTGQLVEDQQGRRRR